ncbi:MAG: hypothetical protein V2A56_11490 [bacterium]
MSARKTGLVVLAAVLTLALIALVQLGCQNLDPVGADGRTGNVLGSSDNRPPQTYLSIVPDPGVLPVASSSNKVMHWWAEDSDGWIVSYEYRWGLLVTDTLGIVVDTQWYDDSWQQVNDSTWNSTTLEQKEFTLPIRTPTAEFTFQVLAVDNEGAIDPDPATITFPVFNSRPDVSFRLASNPVSYAGKTYKTFNVRSFAWDATDPDGYQTIEKVYYALDPLPGDTAWQEMDAIYNTVTLRDLETGEHNFWLKVEDLAGFQSPTIHFPDSHVASDPLKWVVKQPAGDYLIVDDYYLDEGNVHLDFYRAIFDSLYGGEEGDVYSTWELGTELPYVAVDISETLLKFKRVLWYSFYGTPLLRQAFNSMYGFINTPGNRMLLTTMTVDTGMVLDLSDSTYAINYDLSRPRVYTSAADTVYFVPEEGTGLPTMMLDELVSRVWIGLAEKPGIEILYRLDPSVKSPPQYSGTPIVCVRRVDKSYTLLTVPLETIKDPAIVGRFIQVVFDE